MGFLHDGHLSLIRRACSESEGAIVSIFINPTQFGKGEDFTQYPKAIESDLEALQREGVDVVFVPSVEEMYPLGFDTLVVPGALSTCLEGKSRPNHLAGVATVVCKLFSIFRPDRAYFGQKDFQQYLVIDRLSRDLNLGVKVDKIKNALKKFLGIQRRFTKIFSLGKIEFFDDYAHHPTEIKCILEAACSVCEGKIVVVFEPHRYSRVFSLYKKFVNSFDNADIVFITDIYSAGEDKIKGISKEKLASSISLNGVKDVRLLKNYETLHSNLIEICNRGDFIIFLGAGNISKVAKKITEQFRAELTKSI